MTEQFPTAVEFNNRFLLTIVDELYSCRFGTFLCNSEKERRDMVRQMPYFYSNLLFIIVTIVFNIQKLKETTRSLWSLVADDRDAYLNSHYNMRTRDHVLIPNCSQRRIKLWKQYYLRYNPFVNPMANLVNVKAIFLGIPNNQHSPPPLPFPQIQLLDYFQHVGNFADRLSIQLQSIMSS